VHFKLETDEAQAVQGFLKLVDAQKKSEVGAERAGKKMTAGATAANQAITGLITRYGSFTAIAAGVGAAVRYELKEMAEAADKAGQSIKAARDLLFLGDFARGHPQVQAEIGAMAVQAGLPGVEGRVEVAGAWEMLVSKTANLPPQQREPLMKAALQFRRTTQSDLATILNMMIQIQKTDKAATATQIANLIQQTKTEAGSTTEEMAVRLPEILGLGEAAGLAVPQTAAMYATATSRFGATKATSGLRMMLGRLQGKQLEAKGEAVKRRLGLTKGMPVMEQMAALSQAYQQGKIKLPELQLLFGEEAGPLAAVMIPEYEGLQASLGKITAAYETPGLDLVGLGIEQVYKPGTLEYEEERLRMAQANQERIQQERYAYGGIKSKRVEQEWRNYLREERSELPGWVGWAVSKYYGLEESMAGTGRPTPADERRQREDRDLQENTAATRQLTEAIKGSPAVGPAAVNTGYQTAERF
jgi:hypothetical protein